MFKTQVGASKESSSDLYLRPETAQGIFLNYLNVQKTGRMKIPFGIAQIGKAFRNEIVARQFIFRMREFEQMEMQFFIKPGEQKILDKWLINNQSDEYVIMDKLDGISCLLCTENNKVNLYTRADGITGKDISYIKPFINYIPENVPDNMNIRGELVMSKKNFEKRPGGKINPRNTVSGTVKAKTYRNALYNIDFVAYEVIKPQLEPKEQIEKIYEDRLKHEINIINSMDYASYFLIVSDYIKWAKKNDIPAVQAYFF